MFCSIPSGSTSGSRGNWSCDDLLCCIHAERVTTSYRRLCDCSISPTLVFNCCDESVQFEATALFSLFRRYCSFRAAEVFSSGRHIQLTSRKQARSVELILKRLKRYTVGWLGYYSIADMESRIKSLNEWIRRRIRQIYWKQWKKIKTKHDNLVRLGIDNENAWK